MPRRRTGGSTTRKHGSTGSRRRMEPVELFRDNPTRYLCVEPDAETGQMRPVMKRGRPVFLYLCREDREAR
jgi:hypothetical protein